MFVFHDKKYPSLGMFNGYIYPPISMDNALGNTEMQISVKLFPNHPV